ncbi:uncharacterized protein LOC142987204 [Anticarsia gemmatalis]|uniref:uncharacterized protein LOC142987204 n=1 Tax=Anticarsia gemmatalis TaxID=129554 RepID=UPI003F7605C6
MSTQRMEAMLFDYGTTNRTDYRFGEIKAPVFTVYKEKATCTRIYPPPLKDIHTLCNWKGGGIPFNLLHKPRPIIDTDPTKVQQPYFEPPDDGKEHAIKTRPRLVMTPSVSMDDIEDPKARTVLINDMYTSDMARAMREAVRPYFKVVAPLPDHPANANPIKLPKLTAQYVSPEWRMESCSWDQKQLRSYSDTTRDFWLRQELVPCRACNESKIITAQRKKQCELAPGIPYRRGQKYA